MFDRILFILSFASLVGAGLIAGVFFAFSTFVMRALARLPAPSGIAAMQQINIVVINPIFMAVFLGTALTCLAAVAAALMRWRSPAGGWIILAAALYLVGTFGVTMIFNVPLNNALAKLDPNAAESADFWSQYITRWTIWNHVRCVAAIASTGSFVMALRS